MTFKRPYGAGLAALAVGLFAATAAYAEPTVNKGDNAWMLTSTVLVLLMTIPGLALFYGGLVRSKNMLSVLAQVFYTVCLVTVLWALYGYSLAFTGGSDFIGGFSKAFLMGVTPDSKAATFSVEAEARTRSERASAASTRLTVAASARSRSSTTSVKPPLTSPTVWPASTRVVTSVRAPGVRRTADRTVSRTSTTGARTPCSDSDVIAAAALSSVWSGPKFANHTVGAAIGMPPLPSGAKNA